MTETTQQRIERIADRMTIRFHGSGQTLRYIIKEAITEFAEETQRESRECKCEPDWIHKLCPIHGEKRTPAPSTGEKPE